VIQLLQATYRNGQLVLEEKLGDELEGQKLQIIVFTGSDSPEDKKKRFVKFVDRLEISLPDDYRFDRQSLYDR
jgi:hypothetical protein